MNDSTLKVNKTYSKTQVEAVGLVPKKAEKISSQIFIKNDKVYFFEDLKNNKLRLFSIINERSFFL
ncbi:MAG: hypothetical protein C0595_05105 [Marinilabiliales bacterium]|nr:MAG: hypothetical protein C0595_05105 [Marinilabiliales bacterium]